MSSRSPILRPPQARYLETLLPRRDAIRAEMERFAAEQEVPIAHPALGRLLEALAGARPAGRCLEVGTAIGYGTLCLARGARQGKVSRSIATQLARRRRVVFSPPPAPSSGSSC